MTVIELLRPTTPSERASRSPTLHGEYAYKQGTGIYARLLPGKFLRCGDDPSEDGTFRHTIAVPKTMKRKELRSLLANTFGRAGGCGHSYDCCGCRNAYIHWDSVRRIRRGQYSFVISHTRNY